MTAPEAIKLGKYVWRFKHIGFGGGAGIGIPARVELDEFDQVFESEQDFKDWHKDRTISLAELDESMNYCEYFVREKGNAGNYVREGKSFPVDGSWVGIQDFDDIAKPFAQWLEENGWREDWFLLKEKYQGGNEKWEQLKVWQRISG